MVIIEFQVRIPRHHCLQWIVLVLAVLQVALDIEGQHFCFPYVHFEI